MKPEIINKISSEKFRQVDLFEVLSIFFIVIRDISAIYPLSSGITYFQPFFFLFIFAKPEYIDLITK